jgi:hypothetical protein
MISTFFGIGINMHWRFSSISVITIGIAIIILAVWTLDCIFKRKFSSHNKLLFINPSFRFAQVPNQPAFFNGITLVIITDNFSTLKFAVLIIPSRCPPFKITSNLMQYKTTATVPENLVLNAHTPEYHIFNSKSTSI